MSTRVDTEEIEATRSEKLLAVLLGVFMLVGTIWFYVQVPAWVDAVVPGTGDATVQSAMRDQVRAEEERWSAETARDERREELDVAREEYKVALQEGRDTTVAKQAYDAAQTAYDSAQAELREVAQDAEEAQDALQRAQDEYARDSRGGTQAWIVAVVRLLFVAGWTAVAYRAIARMRRRESRYLALGFAGAAVGAIMALVFAVDYVTDYIDPLDLGPFVLSLLGVAATIVAFRVLQRYLAARLPGRRVRKGECPFCGFPLREAGLEHGPHCAGCGRDVVAPCASCDAPRRVGSSHCTSCGRA